MLIVPFHSKGQDSLDVKETKFLIYSQPLGYFMKDYSIGFEVKGQNKTSYSLIIDYFEPWINDYEINDTPSELMLYEGLAIRPGIKFRDYDYFYTSFEGFYKFSGYKKKLILRENSEGDAYDVYYLESRTCNSFGAACKIGFQFEKYHLFFSPFFLAGVKIRFDEIEIKSKYEGGPVYLLSDKVENKKETHAYPLLRIGVLVGFGL